MIPGRKGSDVCLAQRKPERSAERSEGDYRLRNAAREGGRAASAPRQANNLIPGRRIISSAWRKSGTRARRQNCFATRTTRSEQSRMVPMSGIVRRRESGVCLAWPKEHSLRLMIATASVDATGAGFRGYFRSTRERVANFKVTSRSKSKCSTAKPRSNSVHAYCPGSLASHVPDFALAYGERCPQPGALLARMLNEKQRLASDVSPSTISMLFAGTLAESGIRFQSGGGRPILPALAPHAPASRGRHPPAGNRNIPGLN